MRHDQRAKDLLVGMNLAMSERVFY